MKIKNSHLRNILIFFHIVFAVIGFYAFISNYKLSENLLIQKTLAKQEIVAKAGSSSVENLIKSVQNQLDSFLFSFTQVPENAPIDENITRKQFDSYMQRVQLPVNGIAVYDEKGKLKILANRQHIQKGEGEDFSQTEFIKWSKNPSNKDKVYISTPYIGTTGASIGKTIILVEEPIYFGNTYKGTIAIKLLVDEFRSSFIDSLSTDTSEESFVINNSGIVLAGNSSLLNQNIFTYARKSKWKGYEDFVQKLNRGLKSQIKVAQWIFKNSNDKEKLQLAGISRIDIPNTNNDLYMIVETSEESILNSLSPLKIYGLAWLGFGVLTTAIGGFIVMLLRNPD